MDSLKVHYLLKGFSQVMESRVFEFESMTPKAGRAKYTVTIDLALARKYGIRLQELPLLCKEVLDQCSETAETPNLTYTEAHMCKYAQVVALREEAAKHKKSARAQATAAPAGAEERPWGAHTNS